MLFIPEIYYVRELCKLNISIREEDLEVDNLL